jgi:O-antigen ligase
VLPRSLAVPPLAMVGSTMLVALAAAVMDHRSRVADGFFLAWVVAGVFSGLIALVQVFLPDWADGTLIAHSGLVGRAVGNLRQPNHLSTLLLWSAVAIVPLLESGRLPRALGWPLFALFVFGIELSASRTGMVGVALLALWGIVDRRLARSTRLLLLAAPVVYLIGWGAMTQWARESHHTFGAAARLGESDVSGSRFGIWSNTLAMIRQQPLLGVGFGEFNFAWTLTPFPGRPVAFFDHTHNLVLQLVVELGVPLGLAVLVLLGIALWQAFRRAVAAEGARGAGLRSAFVMVALAAVHSQLEYPLWYAYFLLPAAWAWGWCLAARPDGPAPELHGTREQSPLLMTAGALLIVGSLWSLHEYRVVARIYQPDEDASPLDERIAQGQRTWMFAHHADYAAATVPDHPSEAWEAFRGAPHSLLDTRLMIAWAKAYAERGDFDRARYIAQRLREFRNPEAASFFEPCESPRTARDAFQCQPPRKALSWSDFRRLD